MRRKSKIALILSLVLAFVVSFAAPGLTSQAASSGTEVTITTDKTEYSGDDEIKETVTVKNVTNDTLTDVTVTGNIPSGYVADNAKVVSGQWTATIDKLEAGKSTDVTVTFKKASSEGGSTTPESGSTTDTTTPDNKPSGDSNAPTTGDSPFVFLFLGLAVLSMGGIFFLVKSKKGRRILSVILVFVMGASLWQISPINASAEEGTATPPSDEYELVWSDEFNGAELNRNDWNVELHDPGWVNAEWQEYVDSEENIYLEDGKLVIKPIKDTDPTTGKATYTSGRVNTQGKNDFTYGYFETRAKVPEGMGYLPAFWLMATDENVYGQWPRCGEIDIMEVMGQSTDTLHGTIHYGNPHNQSQGTYKSTGSSFSDDFHTFAVEWEPGKISWYVDGQLYHTESDWHSTTEGLGTLTYPAPFDQPFYIILNLAVGGSWVGYPDETTDFENAKYEIDYVRVYQKESYDENVTKPEKEVILREPDANGNYIVNGDFAVKESLTDDEDWVFLTNGGTADTEINTVDKVTGEKVEEKTIASSKDIKINGTAETLTVTVTYPVKTPTTKTEGALTIDTTNPGTLDYSVQLVQADLPMQKGATYELTFDAYADEARTMIVDISGPDNNYVRYFDDTKVNLTTEKQSFKFTFRMMHDDDANGRLEYNLGNTTPYAAVHLSNVSLKKIGYEEIVDDGTKKVLADGNHVYNGSFQEGENRLAYWDIEKDADATVSVTDFADGRRLKVVVPEGGKVTVSQTGIPVNVNGKYSFSFDAEVPTTGSIDVKFMDKTYDVAAGTNGTFSDKFETGATVTGNDLVFTFNSAGTYYIDNVRIVEDSIVKNGSFNAGVNVGWEGYKYTSSYAEFGVDSLTYDNAASVTIHDTDDVEWKIQLKQEEILLENGKCYELSFKAWSDLERDIICAIQRNGNNVETKDDWTNYLATQTISLTKDANASYSYKFKMKQNDDNDCVLSFSMGTLNGNRITDKHVVYIDDVVIKEIDESEMPEVPATTGDNMFTNGDFASGTLAPWTVSVYGTGAASSNVADNAVEVNVTNPGTEDGMVALKYENLTLEKGAKYKVSFKATAEQTRQIKPCFMDPANGYAWYGGQEFVCIAGEETPIEMEIDVTGETSDTILFQVGLGVMPTDTPACKVKMSDFVLVKVSDADADDSEDDSVNTKVAIDFASAVAVALDPESTNTVTFENTTIGTNEVLKITGAIGNDVWANRIKFSDITPQNVDAKKVNFDVIISDADLASASFTFKPVIQAESSGWWYSENTEQKSFTSENFELLEEGYYVCHVSLSIGDGLKATDGAWHLQLLSASGTCESFFIDNIALEY